MMRLSPMLALLAAAPLARADVLVVDPSGGGDFTYVAAAVDAAAEGDTLLVRAGEYADFLLAGKGLHVVAEIPGSVTFQGGLVIEGLAAGQHAVLSGLVVHGHNGALPEGLSITNCAGSVLLESCEFLGADTDYVSPFGYAGASITDSGAVSFVDCTLRGGFSDESEIDCPGSSSAPDGFRGGPGLLVGGSNVSLSQCDVTGGQGGLGAGCRLAGKGGRGLDASTSFVFAAGSTFSGGTGGMAFDACDCGGDGGTALFLDASAAELLDVTLTGGLPSAGSSAGVPGSTSELAGAASLHVIPGTAPGLVAPAAVSSGALLPVTVAGEAGDLSVLAVSLQPGWLHVPSWHGTLLLGLPLVVNGVALGTLDGSGSKQAVLRAPKLPPGLEEASFFLQAATVDAGGEIHLTGARTVHVLASGLLP